MFLLFGGGGLPFYCSQQENQWEAELQRAYAIACGEGNGQILTPAAQKNLRDAMKAFVAKDEMQIKQQLNQSENELKQKVKEFTLKSLLEQRNQMLSHFDISPSKKEGECTSSGTTRIGGNRGNLKGPTSRSCMTETLDLSSCGNVLVDWNQKRQKEMQQEKEKKGPESLKKERLDRVAAQMLSVIDAQRKRDVDGHHESMIDRAQEAVERGSSYRNRLTNYDGISSCGGPTVSLDKLLKDYKDSSKDRSKRHAGTCDGSEWRERFESVIRYDEGMRAATSLRANPVLTKSHDIKSPSDFYSQTLKALEGTPEKMKIEQLLAEGDQLNAMKEMKQFLKNKENVGKRVELKKSVELSYGAAAQKIDEEVNKICKEGILDNPKEDLVGYSTLVEKYLSSMKAENPEGVALQLKAYCRQLKGMNLSTGQAMELSAGVLGAAALFFGPLGWVAAGVGAVGTAVSSKESYDHAERAEALRHAGLISEDEVVFAYDSWESSKTELGVSAALTGVSGVGFFKALGKARQFSREKGLTGAAALKSQRDYLLEHYGMGSNMTKTSSIPLTKDRVSQIQNDYKYLTQYGAELDLREVRALHQIEALNQEGKLSEAGRVLTPSELQQKLTELASEGCSVK